MFPVTYVGLPTAVALLAGGAESVTSSSICQCPTRPVIVTVTVAMFESSSPSFALKVKVSVPAASVLGV